VTVAVAVELAVDPVKPDVVDVVGVPDAGTTLIVTVVLTGTLLAATSTVVGVVIGLLNVITGNASLAEEFVGDAVPPTEVIRSSGCVAGIGAVGNAMNEPPEAPVMLPVKVLKAVSIRTKPPGA
jgi:hypothetical protein